MLNRDHTVLVDNLQHCGDDGVAESRALELLAEDIHHGQVVVERARDGFLVEPFDVGGEDVDIAVDQVHHVVLTVFAFDVDDRLEKAGILRYENFVNCERRDIFCADLNADGLSGESMGAISEGWVHSIRCCKPHSLGRLLVRHVGRSSDEGATAGDDAQMKAAAIVVVLQVSVMKSQRNGRRSAAGKRSGHTHLIQKLTPRHVRNVLLNFHE